jgi:hypothetical protein
VATDPTLGVDRLRAAVRPVEPVHFGGGSGGE